MILVLLLNWPGEHGCNRSRKGLYSELWSQAFLAPLPNGSAWENRLNICLVLWTRDKWGQWDCWPAPLRCHPQSPLKGHGTFRRVPITTEMQKGQIPLQEGLSWESTDLITVPRKTVEQDFKAIFKHSKNEKIMENWQQGLTKRK